MTRGRGDRLLTGEWAVLGILGAEPAHGFALARRLAPSGDVGRVWSLSRPLAYRASAVLQERGLVAPLRSEPGAGPERTILSLTPGGRERLLGWLQEPVEHVRDIRSSLLLKLVLCELNGVDRQPLLEGQRAALEPVLRSLHGDASGDGRLDPVRVWREEAARAADRFLSRLLADRSGQVAQVDPIEAEDA